MVNTMNTCNIIKSLLVSLLLLFFQGCNGLFYYPSSKIYSNPEKFNINSKDHYYSTEGGHSLHGALLQSSEGDSVKTLMIVFHGNAQNLSAHFLGFRWAIKRGVDVFIFDYSGYGKSEGVATRKQTYHDGLATLKYTEENLFKNYDRIVLVGQSLGGAVLMSSAQNWSGLTQVNLMILDSTFPTYQGAAKSAMASSWITWLLQPLVYVLIDESYSPLLKPEKLDSITKWVMHCTNDKVVDYTLGQEVFTMLGGEKKLITEEECRHIGIFKSTRVQDLVLGELNK